MFDIRWSDDTQAEMDRQEKIRRWYSEAINALEEGKATFLGKQVNLSNPKEVIAFLYVYQKDLSSFHERL